MGAMYPHEVQAPLIQTVSTGVQIQQSYYFEFLETVLLLIILLGILVAVYKLPTFFGDNLFRYRRCSGGWVVLCLVFKSRSLRYFLVIDISIVVFGHASFNKYYKTSREDANQEAVQKIFIS